MTDHDRSRMGVVLIAVVAMVAHHMNVFELFEVACFGGAIFSIASEGHL